MTGWYFNEGTFQYQYYSFGLLTRSVDKTAWEDFKDYYRFNPPVKGTVVCSG